MLSAAGIILLMAWFTTAKEILTEPGLSFQWRRKKFLKLNNGLKRSDTLLLLIMWIYLITKKFNLDSKDVEKKEYHENTYNVPSIFMTISIYIAFRYHSWTPTWWRLEGWKMMETMKMPWMLWEQAYSSLKLGRAERLMSSMYKLKGEPFYIKRIVYQSKIYSYQGFIYAEVEINILL